ncbi:1816_t:CDS:2 [Ambispora gerdemannii]|uniref:1816_t:CDS:1 n=1 Tax=Ambispora gerdemannii TaxID=144530 RepID=A0A9N8WA39_9GLOM|nr:1816_t:CDS:2 [Ambispora gerdemannii]
MQYQHHYHQTQHSGGLSPNTGAGEAHSYFNDPHYPPSNPHYPYQHHNPHDPSSNPHYPYHHHHNPHDPNNNSQYYQTPLQTPPPPFFYENLEIKSQEDHDDSPMHKPSTLVKIWWGGLSIVNIYTLIGTFLLLITIYKEANNKSISKSVFIIIALFELLPRLFNVYQIKKYTRAKFAFWDGIGVFIGKKEAYMLFGTIYITDGQVRRLSLISDMICFFYLAWLFYAFKTNMGNLKGQNSDEVTSKIGLNFIILAITAALLALRAIVDVLSYIFKCGREDRIRRRRLAESSRGLGEIGNKA